ncbi:MAG: HNH endonuclease [Aeromicrobium sp.]
MLNVGRTSRLATGRQRRAIITRQDGVCAAPGCRNTHLEIHHAIWWSHGGRTDLDNMIGLCVRCHHLVHRDLLHVHTDGNGEFTFTNHDNRALRRDHKRRAAIHRETGRINRTRHGIETRRRQQAAPLRM